MKGEQRAVETTQDVREGEWVPGSVEEDGEEREVKRWGRDGGGLGLTDPAPALLILIFKSLVLLLLITKLVLEERGEEGGWS